MAKLTDKQQRFIEEYLLDCNATQAAIRAGYSPKTAQEQSSRLLSNVMVKKKIDERLYDRSKKIEWSAEDILRDLKEIAEDKKEATKNRLRAYELAGKHFKMFTDKIETEHSGGVVIEIGIPDLAED